MVYKKMDLFLNKEDFYNQIKSIEIAEEIPSKIKEGLEGWNFNKYSRKKKFTKITVRFDFRDGEKQKKAQALAEKLKERGVIESYSELEKWEEPEFVIKAHEIITNYAIEFKKMAKKPNIKRILEFRNYEGYKVQHIISLFYCLIASLLKNLGFEQGVIWAYKRHIENAPSPIQYEEIREMTREWVKESDKKRVKNIDKNNLPSFVERFTHLFFNCTGFQVVKKTRKKRIRLEPKVKFKMLFSELWSKIRSSY